MCILIAMIACTVSMVAWSQVICTHTTNTAPKPHQVYRCLHPQVGREGPKMLAHIFAYFGPFDSRSHKVPNLAYCTRCSICCYKEQGIRIIISCFL